MTQPRFAPIAAEDEIRAMYSLEPPRPWTLHRPGELTKDGTVSRSGMGRPGPDQGYALALAERLRGKLVLTPGEHEDDAMTGAVLLAMRRAASFGRAPVLGDIECALGLFGFLSEAPEDLVAFRRERFDGVSHDYWRQRELVDSVPEAALRRSRPTTVTPATSWRELLLPADSGAN